MFQFYLYSFVLHCAYAFAVFAPANDEPQNDGRDDVVSHSITGKHKYEHTNETVYFLTFIAFPIKIFASLSRSKHTHKHTHIPRSAFCWAHCTAKTKSSMRAAVRSRTFWKFLWQTRAWRSKQKKRSEKKTIRCSVLRAMNSEFWKISTRRMLTCEVCDEHNRRPNTSIKHVWRIFFFFATNWHHFTIASSLKEEGGS